MELQVLEQITIEQWLSWKEDIRNKLAETANNFVHIGYRLRQIRESGMFDGAEDIFEFARKEYGLDKSSVSRFIAINEKFSEGGNSLELRSEFKALGSSKLSEMLTLPEDECLLITEKTTVKEIRELKTFNKEADKLVEEAKAEEQEEQQAEEVKPIEEPTEHVEKEALKKEIKAAVVGDPGRKYTNFEKCWIDFFKDKPDTLNKVMELIDPDKDADAVEIINPSGNATHKKGLVFMFMYEYEKGVRYKELPSPEIKQMTWRECLDIIYGIYALGDDDTKSIHERFYQTETKKVVKDAEQSTNSREEAGDNRTEGTAVELQQSNEVDTLPEAQPTEKEADFEEEKGQESAEILNAEPSFCCDVATENDYMNPPEEETKEEPVEEQTKAAVVTEVEECSNDSLNEQIERTRLKAEVISDSITNFFEKMSFYKHASVSNMQTILEDIHALKVQTELLLASVEESERRKDATS